jgi:hypothetical protein
MLEKKMLYHLDHTSSPFVVLIILEMGVFSIALLEGI